VVACCMGLALAQSEARFEQHQEQETTSGAVTTKEGEWPWFERDNTGHEEPFRGFAPPFKPVWIAMPHCCLIERQMNPQTHFMQSTCTQYKIWKCIPEGWACESPMPLENPKLIAFPIGISQDIYDGESHGLDVCFAGCPPCDKPKPQDIRPLSAEGKKKWAAEQAKLAAARKVAADKAAAAAAAAAKLKPATPAVPAPAVAAAVAAPPSGCTRSVVAGKVVTTCKSAATIYPSSVVKAGEKKPVEITPEFPCKKWVLKKGKMVPKCRSAAVIYPKPEIDPLAAEYKKNKF